MHHDDKIDEETGENRNPEIITDYNCTKIGVARNTCRWPMVVFYDLLNISGINALCVYKANHPH